MFDSINSSCSGQPSNRSGQILTLVRDLLYSSHVASTAAGNYGVPVILNNVTYGKASGMAPRAR